ncbi:hypothetical protein LY78DRAFT_499678, partial [Colletotrichum sublineola]
PPLAGACEANLSPILKTPNLSFTSAFLGCGPYPPPPGVITMILSPTFIIVVALPPRLIVLVVPSIGSLRIHRFRPRLPSSPPAIP